MFEKKEIAEINYESMFGEEILRSLQRIEELEEENRKVERELELNILKWSADFSSAKREMRFMKAEMNESREKVSDIKERFTSIVNELRATATSEEMERLSRRIENFNFETFITKEDFAKLFPRDGGI